MVGSGSSINVWTDPWLATNQPLVPISSPTELNRNLKVADLLHAQTGDWNTEAIRLHLPQYEVQIKALPLSQFNMEDELVWLPEKSGTYTTKTGYALCKVNTGEPDLAFDWKKFIWGAKTSPKLKMFLWKIKHNALQVGKNLIRRGIDVKGQCKRCRIIKTERHLFFHCPFAMRVWELIPVLDKPNPNAIATPASFLTACKLMKNLPPTGLTTTDLYPWVLWLLWTARNNLLFEKVIWSEQEIATKAISEVRNWQAAQAIKEQKDPNLPKGGSKLPRQCGPSHHINCFVDAAWNATTKGGGFGCIFKDPFTNNIFHQASGNRCIVGSAFIAEAIAVKTAMLEAVNLGLRTLTIWSDSVTYQCYFIKEDHNGSVRSSI